MGLHNVLAGLADKGYINKELFLKLITSGLKLITGIKKNMQNSLMILREKILLKKRSLVESVFNYLKNHFKLEHSRHRSFVNMLVHIVSTLVAYQIEPNKPHLYENFLPPLIHYWRYQIGFIRFSIVRRWFQHVFWNNFPKMLGSITHPHFTLFYYCFNSILLIFRRVFIFF